MKFIKVYDTKHDSIEDNFSFLVAVDEDDYELLKSDLNHILENEEDYDDVWEEMNKTIHKYCAFRVEEDFTLYWG